MQPPLPVLPLDWTTQAAFMASAASSASTTAALSAGAVLAFLRPPGNTNGHGGPVGRCSIRSRR